MNLGVYWQKLLRNKKNSLMVTAIVFTFFIATFLQIKYNFLVQDVDPAFYAQSAREFSQGDGLITKRFIPLALSNHDVQSHPVNLPMWTNKPLIVWLLGGLFFAFGSSDTVVLLFSYAIYALLIISLYFCTKKRLNAFVFLLLFFSLLDPILARYSLIARPDLLFALLIFLIFLNIARQPDKNYLLNGILLALVPLARPNGYFIILPVALYMIVRLIKRRHQENLTLLAKEGAYFLIPVLLATAWLLYFNYQSYGSIFRFYDFSNVEWLEGAEGIQGSNIGNYILNYYSLDTTTFGYISQHPLFILKKMFSHFSYYIKNFFTISGNPVVILLAIAGMVMIKGDGSIRRLRWMFLGAIVVHLLGTFMYRPSIKIYIWCIPILILFAVAFLQQLSKEKVLRGIKFLVMVILIVSSSVYFYYDYIAEVKASSEHNYYHWDIEKKKAEALREIVPKDGLVISAQNRFEAWFADVYSISMPNRFREDFWPVLDKIRLPHYFFTTYVSREDLANFENDSERIDYVKHMFYKKGQCLEFLATGQNERLAYYIFRIDTPKLLEIAQTKETRYDYALGSNGAEIEYCGECYPNHDCSVAIDGIDVLDEPYNYTAFNRNSYPNVLVLKLKDVTRVKEIELEWYRPLLYAEDFRLSYFTNGEWVEIVEVRNNKIDPDGVFEYEPEGEILAEKIKLEVFKAAGQERLLLDRISVY